MKGYAGKILRVDLFRKEANLKKLPEEMCIEYIGGKGFGAKILFEEVAPKAKRKSAP